MAAQIEQIIVMENEKMRMLASLGLLCSQEPSPGRPGPVRLGLVEGPVTSQSRSKAGGRKGVRLAPISPLSPGALEQHELATTSGIRLAQQLRGSRDVTSCLQKPGAVSDGSRESSARSSSVAVLHDARPLDPAVPGKPRIARGSDSLSVGCGRCGCAGGSCSCPAAVRQGCEQLLRPDVESADSPSHTPPLTPCAEHGSCGGGVQLLETRPSRYRHQVGGTTCCDTAQGVSSPRVLQLQMVSL